MKDPAILYALRDRVLMLKLVGAIRIASREPNRLAAALELFIRQLPKWNDFDQLLIDLTEAEAIDSTHLGLLAQAAHSTLSRWNRPPVILSTHEDINAILESVSFDQVFTILHETASEESGLQPLPSAEAALPSQVRLILEAHRALVRLSPQNERQFRDVVELLDQEHSLIESRSSDRLERR